MVTDERETKVDVSRDPNRYFSRDRDEPFFVPAHELVIEVPFTGESVFWKLRPSTWKSVFPHGQIVEARGDTLAFLRLTYSRPVDALNEEQLGREIQGDLDLIRFYISNSATEVTKYNADLRVVIEQAINSRKDRIQKTEGVALRLGLPTKRNMSAPELEPIKVSRKLVRPLPAVASGTYTPEYGIEDETYAHILAVIRHELATFEATPATYKNLGEEDLRNILLAHLNGHYEGGATGETFRKGGKTDIRIETENRAAFVAECKLWSGPKALTEAIDQLLGYLTWRDCKAALIVFNKSVKGFSSILERVAPTLKAHQNAKRDFIATNAANEWRLCFQSANDQLREVTIHVFVADLSVSSDA
ncbi:MAG: hypothetical protein AB7I01_14595 [Gammaproteobacteria bacterium]